MTDETNETLMSQIRNRQYKYNLVAFVIILIVFIALLFAMMFLPQKPRSTIYCLYLYDDKYYVGMTSNFETRYKQHMDGSGAQWTKHYKPINVVMTKQVDRKDAPCEETRITCLFMNTYGYQNVRGAEYAEDRVWNSTELIRIKFACRHHLNTGTEDESD